MIHFYATFKGAAVLMTIILGSYVSGMLADTISETTPISLGAAVGVIGVAVGGAWYLSARLQKIDMRLKEIEGHIKSRNNDES